MTPETPSSRGGKSSANGTKAEVVMETLGTHARTHASMHHVLKREKETWLIGDGNFKQQLLNQCSCEKNWER